MHCIEFFQLRATKSFHPFAVHIHSQFNSSLPHATLSLSLSLSPSPSPTLTRSLASTICSRIVNQNSLGAYSLCPLFLEFLFIRNCFSGRNNAAVICDLQSKRTVGNKNCLSQSELAWKFVFFVLLQRDISDLHGNAGYLMLGNSYRPYSSTVYLFRIRYTWIVSALYVCNRHNWPENPISPSALFFNFKSSALSHGYQFL